MKPDVRQISFKTLCDLCRHNGANHQEYGRLCPHPTRCLAPGVYGAKLKAKCPVWARLANNGVTGVTTAGRNVP